MRFPLSKLFAFLTACFLCTSCFKGPSLPSPKSDFVLPKQSSTTWYCPEFYSLYQPEDGKLACQMQPCQTGYTKDEKLDVCCANGTAFDPKEGDCVGTPRCPEGMKVFENECVPVDELAWYEKQCEQGNARDCELLAGYLLFTGSEQASPARAREVAGRECQRGSIHACVLFAFSHVRDEFALIPNDIELANELMELACAGGDKMGCLAQAVKLESEEDTFEEGLRVRERLCGKLDGVELASDAFVCQLHDRARYKYLGERAQLDATLDAMRVRCEESQSPGICSKYVQVVRWTNKTSPEQARALYREVLRGRCMREDEAFAAPCSVLLEYAIEEDRSQEPYRSRLKGWCEEGNYTACYRLGDAIESASPAREDEGTERERYKSAIPYLERACQEGGHARSCLQLLSMAVGERGLPDNPSEILARSKAACDRGSVLGCKLYVWRREEQLGEKEEPDEQEIEEVRQLYTELCAYPDHGACSSLALFSLRYRGKMNRDKAGRYSFALLERSCFEGKNRYGCYLLGFHHEIGIGTGKDKDSAREHYRSSCSMGALAGCQSFLSITPNASGTELLEAFLSSKPEDEEQMEKAPAFEEDMTLLLLPGGAKVDSADSKTLENMSESVAECKRDKKECKKIEARFDRLVKSAYETFVEQCEEGDGNACWYANEILFKEVGKFTFERAEIMRLLELGCQARESRSCGRLGKRHLFSYWDEDSSPQDAWSYLSSACEEGKGFYDCNRALFAAALNEADLDTARASLEPVCEDNELTPVYCEDLTAKYLYTAALNDLEKLAPFHEERCEEAKHPASCALAARARFARDPALATELVPAVCGEGTAPELCIERGWQLVQAPETSAAGVEVLSAWCERDHGAACYELGMHHASKEGIGNQIESREALERSCELDHMLGCFQMGKLYGDGNKYIEVDLKRAKRYYTKACNGFHVVSCKLSHDIELPDEEDEEMSKKKK